MMAKVASSEEILRVFDGELDRLPPKESNVVRVFISSTFTDFKEERNIIFREAIPELRKHCNTKNLDFQVADMRWGVRDDAQNDHQTTKLVLREVENSQRISRGPNFVALLGNRYGSRSFPSEIEATEFKVLMNAAFSISKDHTLFEQWFKLDENAVPPTYILQPITTQFPYYNDESDENAKKRDKDRKQWNLVYDLLTALFRASAQYTFKTGHFSTEQRQKYFMSVTEAEVQKGIVGVKGDVEDTALCFRRQLNSIDLNSSIAKRFIDMEAGQVDTEAQRLLSDLRDGHVRRVLPADNMNEDTIEWDEEGVNPEDFDHLRYLNFFKNAFTRMVGGLIVKALRKSKTMNTNKELYTEVLQHSCTANKKNEHFVGRIETLNRIKFKLNKIYYREDFIADNLKGDRKALVALDQYIDHMAEDEETAEDTNLVELRGMYSSEAVDNLNLTAASHELDNDMSLDKEMAAALVSMKLKQYTKPLVVYGQSGSGKTAMIAQIAKLSRGWFEHTPVRIIRFCGTSPGSMSIPEVLGSICMQIWQTYSVKVPTMLNLRRDFAYLVEYFKSLLYMIDTTEKPLMILIDSVDQLGDVSDPNDMRWLPQILPPNVYMIVSLIPNYGNLLENCKKVLTDEDRYIEIPTLPKDTGAAIIKQWLRDANRKLSTEQTEFILAKLRMCPTPLFLKLCFEQARYWCSYTSRDEWTLGITSRSLIEQMFIKVEKDHGKILVTKALGYLTVAKSGVTDTEMEDLLSLEDAVLQDSYIYHLPPDPQLIRIPPLLWARLKADIDQYLVDYQVGAKTITKWHHRQFWETAEKRYLAPATKTLMHSNMVDYFTGKWADVAKPISFTKKKKGVYEDAKRGVPDMPCMYEQNAYNYAKLNELPYHLSKCSRHEDFVSYVCYDFNMLYVKCKAINIQELLNDLMVEKSNLESEIQIIVDKEEEERRKQERERRKKKAPDMEVGKTAVTITDAVDEGEDEFTENREDEEDEPATPLDIANVDIFALTSIQPLTLTELRDCLHDVQLIIDMLVLGYDSITRDPDNFLLQVMGQLGCDEVETEGLADIRAKARAFITDTSIPLLTPQTRCMPAPGSELKTSLDISIGFPGDAYDLERKVAMTSDGKTLYVVERNSNTSKKSLRDGNCGDFLRIHDITQNGRAKSMETLPGFDVRKMYLMGGDRYLYFEVYKRRDNYRPECFTCVVDTPKHFPLPFAPDTRVIGFSVSGRYCLIVEPYYRTDKKQTTLANRDKSNLSEKGDETKVQQGNEISTQTEQPTVSTVEIAVMYDMETNQKTSLQVFVGDDASEENEGHRGQLKVYDGGFSPDEKFIIAHTNGRVTYCFLVERGKYMYKWGEGKKNLLSFGADYDSVAFEILPKNYLVQAGLSYNEYNWLYVRNLNNGETIREVQCGGYDVTKLEVNKSFTLCAAGTSESGCSSSKGETKDVYVWNLEKGDLVSKCSKRDPINALYFIGEEDQYLLVCPWGCKLVEVWYIGTVKHPCLDAVKIHNLIGHSNDVLTLHLSEATNTIVTSSKDNTIKFWSLDRVLARCSGMLCAGGEGLGEMKALKEHVKAKEKKPCDPSKMAVQTTAITISVNNRVGALGTSAGWVLFFDIELHEPLSHHHCSKTDKEVIALVTSQDGCYIISGGREQNIIIFDAETGDYVKEIEPTKPIDCMVESKGLLVCGQSGMECYGVCYNINTGQVVSTLQGLYGFSTICMTSSAKEIITTMFDYPMIFNAKTGEQHNATAQPDTMLAGCTCLRISPNDKLVASCSSDGSVKVMEIESGKYKFRLQHKSSVVAAAFANNSASLVTSGFRNILVWNMRTGALSHTLQRHQNFITDVKFSTCGKYLISAGLDKQIIIWDYEIGASIATYIAHCPLRHFAVSRDLTSILYAPENIGYLAVVKPNPSLGSVLRGEEVNPVPEPMIQAQAFAFAFSGQRVKEKSSRACNIL